MGAEQKNRLLPLLPPAPPPPAHLQAQSDPLGDRRLGEDGLHVRNQPAAEAAALWANQVALLLDAGNHGEVEREIGGEDPPDALLLQLLVALQVCGDQTGVRPGGAAATQTRPPPTFIHAVQNGFQDLVAVAIAVFLPDRTILAAEDDELSIAPAQ